MSASGAGLAAGSSAGAGVRLSRPGLEPRPARFCLRLFRCRRWRCRRLLSLRRLRCRSCLGLRLFRRCGGLLGLRRLRRGAAAGSSAFGASGAGVASAFGASGAAAGSSAFGASRGAAAGAGCGCGLRQRVAGCRPWCAGRRSPRRADWRPAGPGRPSWCRARIRRACGSACRHARSPRSPRHGPSSPAYS